MTENEQKATLASLNRTAASFHAFYKVKIYGQHDYKTRIIPNLATELLPINQDFQIRILARI